MCRHARKSGYDRTAIKEWFVAGFGSLAVIETIYNHGLQGLNLGHCMHTLLVQARLLQAGLQVHARLKASKGLHVHAREEAVRTFFVPYLQRLASN